MRLAASVMQTGWSSSAAGVPRCRCRRPHRASARVEARCKAATPGLPLLPVDSFPLSVAVVSSETPAAHFVVLGSAQKCSAVLSTVPLDQGHARDASCNWVSGSRGWEGRRRDSPDEQRADEAARTERGRDEVGSCRYPPLPAGIPPSDSHGKASMLLARAAVFLVGLCWPGLLVLTSHATAQNTYIVVDSR